MAFSRATRAVSTLDSALATSCSDGGSKRLAKSSLAFSRATRAVSILDSALATSCSGVGSMRLARSSLAFSRTTRAVSILDFALATSCSDGGLYECHETFLSVIDGQLRARHVRFGLLHIQGGYRLE